MLLADSEGSNTDILGEAEKHTELIQPAVDVGTQRL
jgi:hypothetical protein